MCDSFSIDLGKLNYLLWLPLTERWGFTQYPVNLSFLIHILCADFYFFPLAALTYSFHALTCPSLCGLQNVSAPCSVAFFLSVS